MAKVNVLIADGRKLLREGLAALLQKHAGIRVVGEADEIIAAGKLIGPLGVHVVILNVSPPAHASSETVAALAHRHPDVGIIALAHSPSPLTVRALLDAGARGCLTKECASAELVAAIRTVVEGRIYLSPRLTEAVTAAPGRPRAGGGSLRPLAPREREILRRIAAGQSTKQIAFELGVGTKTIETHRRRIMDKLGRHSIAELTQYAVMEGLISLETHA